MKQRQMKQCREMEAEARYGGRGTTTPPPTIAPEAIASLRLWKSPSTPHQPEVVPHDDLLLLTSRSLALRAVFRRRPWFVWMRRMCLQPASSCVLRAQVHPAAAAATHPTVTSTLAPSSPAHINCQYYSPKKFTGLAHSSLLSSRLPPGLQ